MTQTRNLYVDTGTLNQLQRYLLTEPESESEHFGENRSVTYTAPFKNGYEVDICCHGVQYKEGYRNTAVTTATLYFNGMEVSSVDGYRFLGAWTFEHDGNTFVVIVLPSDPKSLSNLVIRGA